MNAIISTEMRLIRDATTGYVYTTTAEPYSFWERYLHTFERIRVVARVESCAVVSRTALRADGPGVEFVDLPYYVGPRAYLACRRKVRAILSSLMGEPDAIILRVPSQIGVVASDILTRLRKPFGLEVVGDPWDVFRPNASDHPLRAAFRWWFSFTLRRQCRAAACTAYVTQWSLQRRFPPKPGRFTISYSSIELGADAFVDEPRTFSNSHGPRTLVTVASLEQPYKGVDLLLEALAQCLREGFDLRLVIVGDGRLRPELENLAARLGLTNRVKFTGALPRGKPVRDYLDAADLFVLASRTEGLPRVVIEAMARGLPCLATGVGGTPELLEESALVKPGASAVAGGIRNFLNDPARMSAASIRNLAKAREYAESTLRARRDSFYSAVVEATVRDWQRGNPALSYSS